MYLNRITLIGFIGNEIADAAPILRLDCAKKPLRLPRDLAFSLPQPCAVESDRDGSGDANGQASAKFTPHDSILAAVARSRSNWLA